MVDPVSILTGIALVKKSVDFIKSNIATAQDIGDVVGHVEKAFEGQKQVIKAREKKGADPFATENVAKEIIDARLAQEALYEMKLLIDHRFGHGTWSYILEERKKRIDARKEAIKEAKAKAHKKQQEIMEYVKWGLIAVITLAFISVAIGVTVKFLVTLNPPAYAHDLEYDDGTCKLYEPRYFLMCLSEGREFTDTQIYLDYKIEKDQYIESID